MLHNSCNTCTHVTTIHCSMHIQTILGGNFFMKYTISNFTGKNFHNHPKVEIALILLYTTHIKLLTTSESRMEMYVRS